MDSFQPKTILSPTDFSELATFALATCWEARLLVLYADPFTPPPYFTVTQLDEVVRSLEHSKCPNRHR